MVWISLGTGGQGLVWVWLGFGLGLDIFSQTPRASPGICWGQLRARVWFGPGLGLVWVWFGCGLGLLRDCSGIGRGATRESLIEMFTSFAAYANLAYFITHQFDMYTCDVKTSFAFWKQIKAVKVS